MSAALIVLDASAAMALLLSEGEGSEVENLIRDTVSKNGQIFVPGLFWYELGNGLLMAEGRDRVTTDAATQALLAFTQLPIVTHQAPNASTQVRILGLAQVNGLTYYDASYLELTVRCEAPLRTFDSHLTALKTTYPVIL